MPSRRPGRKRSSALPDEFGGFADGGLAILDPEGVRIHVTPARVATALRYFLARVELHSADGLPPRLALSSALIGEGVTFITRSLASIVAYDGNASVAIVDLNWRRPTAHAAPADGAGGTDGAEDGAQDAGADGTGDGSEGAGDDEIASRDDGESKVPTAPPPPKATRSRGSKRGRETETPTGPRLGLVDAVERNLPIDEILVKTANPRLCIVPAGEAAVSRRPALAASGTLARVLDELEERFDHLLLDLPPVLSTSEAMNLSQLADAYVLVVRQGATSEGQVEAALEEMQGGDVLGVILNRYQSRIPPRLRRLIGT